MDIVVWGYIFTAVNYVFYCISRFMYSKKDILFLNLFAKVFTVLGLYCMGSMTGVGVMSLNFIVCILCYLKERNQWKMHVVYWLLIGILITILVNTFAGISSLLVFTTSVLNLTANWWLPPQQMRMTAAAGSVLYLLYQISIANWAGLLEVFSFGSNLLSWLRYREKKTA